MESFPKEERGLAMAVYMMGVIVTPVFAPILGGWITDNLSWRWIFFINIPIGLLSLFLVYSLCGRSSIPKEIKLKSPD